MSDDYGELVTRLLDKSSEWDESGCSLYVCEEAADAIEALTRENAKLIGEFRALDLMRGAEVERLQARADQLVGLLKRCVPWLKVYQSGEEAFGSSLAGQRVLELLADIDAVLTERQPREEGTR